MRRGEHLSGYSLLGITVHALTMDDLHALIKEAVEKHERYLIGHHNLHSLYIFHHLPDMRDFYQHNSFTHIDGMPLVLLGRLLGHPLSKKHRVTYVDWIHPLLREAAKESWRLFYLGSRPGVAARGAALIKQEIPTLQLETGHGYFDATAGSIENEQVLQRIEGFRPNILMVGMGMPRQELWVRENMDRIRANVILTAGACMDYLTGTILTPPRWMGQWGLEWLYRLLSEPKRLWHRYLLEPWFVLFLLLQELKARNKGRGAKW